MSSEPRLRERLDRATSRLEPDVDRHLHQALERGRRRVAVRRVGTVAGIAAAIVLIVVGGPRLLRSLPDEQVPAPPGPSPTASAAPVDVEGTWTATVEPGQVRATLEEADLGQWADQLIDGTTGPGYPQDLRLRLRDGRYDLTDADGQALDHGTYTVDGSELKLAQEPNGVAIYEVSLDGDTMTLTFVSDSAQPYPPDMPPHEAETRAMYSSAPFERV